MMPPMGGARAANDLPPNHPVRVWMGEHEILLGFLDQLEQAATDARKSAAGLEPGSPARVALVKLASNLLDAEPHHQREEQALFPRMEEVGIEGPPHMMRLDHDELRLAKRALSDHVTAATPADEAFVERFCQVADFIVQVLRSHIHKENEILYPMALQAIGADGWRAIQADCERIGPCSFTKRG
ncbi:MAG: hemerythrin domain-containing protein [Deltaproteobacteria bacterium]|nr:hemerythrin domain-containing protein [Deltaproteobacteria bacterium]